MLFSLKVVVSMHAMMNALFVLAVFLGLLCQAVATSTSSSSFSCEVPRAPVAPDGSSSGLQFNAGFGRQPKSPPPKLSMKKMAIKFSKDTQGKPPPKGFGSKGLPIPVGIVRPGPKAPSPLSSPTSSTSSEISTDMPGLFTPTSSDKSGDMPGLLTSTSSETSSDIAGKGKGDGTVGTLVRSPFRESLSLRSLSTINSSTMPRQPTRSQSQPPRIRWPLQL